MFKDRGEPISRIIEALLTEHEKQEFFRRLGQDFERLWKDTEAYQSYKDDIAVWDGMLADGLDSDAEINAD